MVLAVEKPAGAFADESSRDGVLLCAVKGDDFPVRDFHVQGARVGAIAAAGGATNFDHGTIGTNKRGDEEASLGGFRL